MMVTNVCGWDGSWQMGGGRWKRKGEIGTQYLCIDVRRVFLFFSVRVYKLE